MARAFVRIRGLNGKRKPDVLERFFLKGILDFTGVIGLEVYADALTFRAEEVPPNRF